MKLLKIDFYINNLLHTSIVNRHLQPAVNKHQVSASLYHRFAGLNFCVVFKGTAKVVL